MLPRLLLLFIVMPLVELGLLFYIGHYIGGWETFGLVILTGALGAVLARREGTRCWYNIQQKLATGQAPAAELIEGPLILLAGAFLITPGVITDSGGLLLLLPPIRRRIARRIATRLRSRFTIHAPDGFSDWPSRSEEIDDESCHPSGDKIIDVTFHDPEGPSDRD